MNRTHALVTIMLFGVVYGRAVGADDDWTTTSESFICRSSTEVREIKTYVGAAAEAAVRHGCRVDYVRNGSTRTLWSSVTEKSYCNGKASALATKLEASHFSCQPLHPDGSSKDK
jgi:hypothetical protein